MMKKLINKILIVVRNTWKKQYFSLCRNNKSAVIHFRKLLKQIIIIFDNKNAVYFYTLRTEKINFHRTETERYASFLILNTILF